LAAGIALLDFGLESEAIRRGMETFPGIEHRLEFFHQSRGGVRYYNDSAATIPEAAAAAVEAFDRPPVLVSGGTDKALDFAPLAAAAKKAKAVVLLAGTGSELLMSLLRKEVVPFEGPYATLDEAAVRAVAIAAEGDAVVLSPGCTSFGMFLNEFDRGRKWKDAVIRLAP
jgi:UDP-N-acetylmuramoylalanine--D-glutamate ligase